MAKAKKSKRGTPAICACPTGSRMRLREGRSGTESVCVEPPRADRPERVVSPTCSDRTRRYVIGAPSTSAKVATPAAFTYTTPSATPEIGSKGRVARGCIVETFEAVSKKGAKKGEVVVRKVPLPYSCPPGSTPDGKRCRTSKGETVEPVVDDLCGKTNAPCATSRTACPVQLVYKRGRPHLRFCTTAGNKRPGWLVPVDSPASAQALALEACTAWANNGRKFSAENAAVLKAKAAGAGYEAPAGETALALGRARRRARRAR